MDTVALCLAKHAKADADFCDGDEDANHDENDDDPCDCAHLCVGDRVGEDLGQVEKDAATLVEDLDARVDLEIFADGGVEGVEGWFRLPEEVGDVENVGCWSNVSGER